MAQKPDYYEVLGVAKTATEAEIKAAFKKIAMKNHPDMLRNKSDAEKAAAAEKFQLAKEAQEVLTDATKRRTYDQHGHNGLENLKAGGGTGQSYTEAAGGRVKKEAFTEENVMDFFDRIPSKPKSSPTSGAPTESSAERRARIAEERAAARRASRGETASPQPVTETFKESATRISDATARVKEATLPVEDLQLIRDKAAELVDEVDAAIERARKNGRPGPRP